MPKEQINFPVWKKTGHGLPGSTGSDEAATAEIEDVLLVRWHDNSLVEGYVQMSLVSQEPMAWADFEAADVDPGSGPVVNTATERFTPVLSRDDLNRMIKVLRRARDSAYGKDA
jgi:hypothetical protein